MRAIFVLLQLLLLVSRALSVHAPLHFRNSASNSSIVVLGAAGFIGFHLSAALRESGVDVFAYDTFTNSHYSPSYKYQRAWALLLQHRVDVSHQNVCAGQDLSELLTIRGVSHIVYLGLGDSVRSENIDENGVDSCFKKLFEMSKYSAEVLHRQSPIIVYAFPSQLDCGSTNCDISQVNVRIQSYAFEQNTKYDVNSIGLLIPDALGPWQRLDRSPYTLLTEGTFSEKENSSIEFSFVGDIARGIVHVMKYCKGTHLFYFALVCI